MPATTTEHRVVAFAPFTIGFVLRLLACLVLFLAMAGIYTVGPFSGTVEQWIAGGLFLYVLSGIIV